MRFLPLLVVVVVSAGGHALVSGPNGDFGGIYTDHLRHLAESQALVARGSAIYRQPYAEATQGLLPCPEHTGLFPERTAPYPPLGVLLHWPLGALERHQLLSPATSHQLTATAWLICGLCAVWLAWRLVTSQLPGRLGLVLIVAPLTIGVGANGFYDTTFLLAGVGALVLLASKRPEWAMLALGLAAALHFRALVFAPVGLWALLEALRRDRRRALAFLGVSGLLVASAAWAAWHLSGTLDTIPADNPVHASHLLHARAPLRFLVIAAVAVGSLVAWRARWTALTVVAAVLVAMSDRSYGFWHALPLIVPPLVVAAEQGADRRAAWVAWGWTLAAVLGAFLYPFTAPWQWLADVVAGRLR
ncbi:MAG: hypothetical protein SFW67_15985 [Myxococcaceae bacterium]|nr:hypothetical protein [Myxococcaceae bacterium]